MPKKTVVEQRLDDLKEQLTKGFERMEKALEKHAADDKETFDDQCERITELETSYAGLVGKLSIVAVIASAGVAAAAKYLMP